MGRRGNGDRPETLTGSKWKRLFTANCQNVNECSKETNKNIGGNEVVSFKESKLWVYRSENKRVNEKEDKENGDKLKPAR